MSYFNDEWLLTKCEVRFRDHVVIAKSFENSLKFKQKLKEGVLEKKKKPPLPRKLSIPP